MEPKLRQYIEAQFAGAPDNAQAAELREEIIRNTVERYHDLLAQGKTEEEAYALALDGVGDIGELLAAFGVQPEAEEAAAAVDAEQIRSRTTVFRSIAVGLYILCVAPVIVLASSLPLLGAAMIFYFVGTATGLLIYESITRRALLADGRIDSAVERKGIFRAVGVGLYISCPTPCILMADTAAEDVSPALLFLMVAAATVLMILSRTPKLKAVPRVHAAAEPRTVALAEPLPKPRRGALYRVSVAVLWTAAAIFFIITPFAWGIAAWSAAWLVFPLAICLQNLLRAIFDYTSEVSE